MSDRPPRHSDPEIKAAKIALGVNDAERDALLLWTAYLKRIKPVPYGVMQAAVKAFRVTQLHVFAIRESTEVDKRTMDRAGELLWSALDESARREWLLKAV